MRVRIDTPGFALGATLPRWAAGDGKTRTLSSRPDYGDVKSGDVNWDCKSPVLLMQPCCPCDRSTEYDREPENGLRAPINGLRAPTPRRPLAAVRGEWPPGPDTAFGPRHLDGLWPG